MRLLPKLYINVVDFTKVFKTTTHEALRGVVHEAELEALLVEEGFSQGPAQRVRRQRALLAELQLREQLLRTNKHPQMHYHDSVCGHWVEPSLTRRWKCFLNVTR